MPVSALKTTLGAPAFGMGIAALLRAHPEKTREINDVVKEASANIDKRLNNYMSTTGIDDAVPGSRKAFNDFQKSVTGEEYERAKSQLGALLEGTPKPGGRRKKTQRRKRGRKTRKTRHSRV